MGGVNVAYGSGGNRHSARLHSIRVCQQQKQPASGAAPKNPDKLKNTTSVALENCDVEGQRSPATPIQSQSQRQINSSSEQIVKKFVSRISRTSSAKTEGNKNCDLEGLGNPATPIQSRLRRKVKPSSEQIPTKSVSRFSRTLSAKSDVCYKKKRVTVETKEGRAKQILTKSSSSEKNLHEKDVSHLVKGRKKKTSSVSAEALSFRKSRSGRLLLPPLEFWRNQIPVYNADHELTEIQEGASLV
ncbi:kinetochore-associated protein KNL-2 homolog [Abrus precatorius]|uniref:Kinetochore-associated protein KNL-2 homolog n=1 Tax=Abrus precatorius TaxID=3816 RepID=A0A8B8MHI4_ABRPR|nr:kinetochore-associated protein KNL-2 homolog [Abrus precatorius]